LRRRTSRDLFGHDDLSEKSERDDARNDLFPANPGQDSTARPRRASRNYHKNLGAQRAADGACCNFLRVNYADLRDRVLQGGTDEEILEWCFENGRRPNEGDLMIWNSFSSKLGWNDFATPRLEREKQKHGIADRTDIVTIPDLIDLDEGRKS
jgi:hypothetical protein